MEIKEADILLCEFYFSDLKKSKNRPVLVLKDNLPYNDFVAIPISSKINSLHEDEVLLDNSKFEARNT
jgi:mRNA interferase MazF